MRQVEVWVGHAEAVGDAGGDARPQVAQHTVEIERDHHVPEDNEGVCGSPETA